jgi:hypothetical protein
MLRKPISADSHITEPPTCYVDHIDPADLPPAGPSIIVRALGVDS